MKAQIGAACDIGGTPSRLRLEVWAEDMPDDVLKKILEDIGYRCEFGAGGVGADALYIVPHKERCA